MEPQNNQKDFLSAVQNATPEQLDVQTTKHGDVQMNVVNAVNANGVVSGRKVVDFIWQRIGICAMIIAAGCLVAVLVMVIIANNYNSENIKVGFERDALKEKLSDLYKALKVDDQSDALTTIGHDEYVNGADLQSLYVLLSSKYGDASSFDFGKTNDNFLRKNGAYKVLSLMQANNRVFAYAKVADGQWKLAEYNAMYKNPCEKSSEDEIAALKGIITCPEEE